MPPAPDEGDAVARPPSPDIPGYCVRSSPTVHEIAPLGPEGWHVHKHSLMSGTGGPSSRRVRNFGLPVGAPTWMMAPLAVGLATLQVAQALASQRLPGAAFAS